jgi:hypothetical protein
MTGLGLLDRIDRQCPDGVDGEPLHLALTGASTPVWQSGIIPLLSGVFFWFDRTGGLSGYSHRIPSAAAAKWHKGALDAPFVLRGCFSATIRP